MLVDFRSGFGVELCKRKKKKKDCDINGSQCHRDKHVYEVLFVACDANLAALGPDH